MLSYLSSLTFIFSSVNLFYCYYLPGLICSHFMSFRHIFNSTIVGSKLFQKSVDQSLFLHLSQQGMSCLFSIQFLFVTIRPQPHRIKFIILSTWDDLYCFNFLFFFLDTYSYLLAPSEVANGLKVYI